TLRSHYPLTYILLSSSCYGLPLVLHSFPTRRSSDLHAAVCSSCSAQLKEALEIVGTNAPPETGLLESLQTGTPTRQKNLAEWERSEEHTSELQSLAYLVCRLLLEKKNSSDEMRSPNL